MPKEKLSKKEFAIKEGAKIVFPDKPKINIKKNGTVTITLNGKLDSMDDIQVGQVDNDEIKLPGRCGVFNTESGDNFKEGKIKDVFLFLQANPAATTDNDIVLKSSGNDIVVKTDGEEGKGNHGSLNFAPAGTNSEGAKK